MNALSDGKALGLLVLFLATLLATVPLMGGWLARLSEGRLPAPLLRLERAALRLCGAGPGREMDWKEYALAVLAFSVLGVIAVYALQRFQALLPLNPQAFPAVAADSAMNTALSFVTNTNWQGYSGEATMSYLTQMLALTVQNFLSAATAVGVVFALIRGFARKEAGEIGNFWVDLWRATAYLLLPLSFVFALVLASQGVIQNFSAYREVALLQPVEFEVAKNTPEGKLVLDAAGKPVMEKQATDKQQLAMGPVASQLAIKMLGTNGGGFFNANSAHPYENPTAFTNFLQVLAIFLIPAGLCHAFGLLVGDKRQGRAVLAAMTLMFVVATVAVMAFEQQGNPALAALGADGAASATQPGGNMEGKEARFGIAASTLFAAVTTAASCGAVNAMHDSFTPLGGLVPMWLIQFGEVIFGGVGSGLYGMLVYAILAVFVAGLMIGRTPEYLGKKIGIFEMKMVSLAILVTPMLVLFGTAAGVLAEAGRAGMANPVAHGLSEVLYAFSSAANNNGSAFAGLSANTPFYNALLGIAVWIGRFGILVPVLAIAGSLAAKKSVPVSSGTLPTHGALFVVLLVSTVVIVGALTYIPALALGPVVEHLVLWGAK
jgi:K+-transporting ATPase ATPase A chain